MTTTKPAKRWIGKLRKPISPFKRSKIEYCFKELCRILPLRVILTGLDKYEREIFVLRRVERLSVKDIATIKKKDVCQVRYDLQKIDARIRYRVRKIIREGKVGPAPLD